MSEPESAKSFTAGLCATMSSRSTLNALSPQRFRKLLSEISMPEAVRCLLCRAETARLRQELAVGLQGKLSSTGSIDSIARRGMLPWEVSGCRERAASVLKRHMYAEHPGKVGGVVNKAIKAMGYSGGTVRGVNRLNSAL